jgi:peroxiredoxin-like protein
MKAAAVGRFTEAKVANHLFALHLEYAGGVSGGGRLSLAGLETRISVPREMGGAGVGTNPEELLLSAAASCYAITLSAIAARRDVPIKRIDMESECFVETGEKRMVVRRIVHRPILTLEASATSEARVTTEEVARIAEQACMVSAALRGNVQIDVEPSVRVP